MKRCTSLGAIPVVALASSAHAGFVPIQWDIQASFHTLNGEVPAGVFENMDTTWTAEISLTIDSVTEIVEPSPDAEIDTGDFRLGLSGGLFSYNSPVPGPSGEAISLELVEPLLSALEPLYMPMNMDTFDSADVFFGALPFLSQDLGDPELLDLRFGFFGPPDTFTAEDPFLDAPNLDDLFGTGFNLTFENGVTLFGTIDVWDTTFIPTPGATALIAFGAMATLRRRR